MNSNKVLQKSSIGSISIKNINVNIIFLILLTSVLSIPIKSIISVDYTRLIYTSLEILLYFILFATICIKDGKFIYNKFDTPVYLYLIYGLFLIIWSIVNNNGLYEIFVKFKIFFLPFIIYFILRNHLFYDFSLSNKIKYFLFIVILLVEMELFFEFISLKFFGFDLETLPWVAFIQNQRGGFEYYIGSDALRVISIFSYIHNAALLSVVGFFMFWLEYRNTNKKIYGTLTIISLIGILIASSRTSFVGLVLGLLYIIRFDSKVIKSLLKYGLLIAVVFIIFISTVLNTPYISAHQEGFKAFFIPRNDNMNVFPFSDGSVLKNMVYLFLGVGLGDPDELASRYTLYGVYGIEIRLITVLLFQYGLVYLFILAYLLFQIFKVKNFDKTIIFYKAILIQFIVSLIHYYEMFTVGVFEVFIIIYALIIAYIINYKKSNRVHQSSNEPSEH